jgi:hypothetical protein
MLYGKLDEGAFRRGGSHPAFAVRRDAYRIHVAMTVST